MLVGVADNLILHWNVWDYTDMPLNLYGQICLPFTILWFFLCIPALWLCERVASLFHPFRREHPHYTTPFENSKPIQMLLVPQTSKTTQKRKSFLVRPFVEGLHQKLFVKTWFSVSSEASPGLPASYLQSARSWLVCQHPAVPGLAPSAPACLLHGHCAHHERSSTAMVSSGALSIFWQVNR